MKILYLTNMYPREYGDYFGIFIKKELEELRKLGFVVDYIFVNGRRSKINYLSIFNILSSMKESYDLVNVNHSLLLPHALFAKKILSLNVPIVFTLHEGELSYNLKSENILHRLAYSKLWRKPLLQQVDLIITKNKEILKNLGDNIKSVEISSAVDTEIFKPIKKEEAKNKLDIKNNELVMFFPADKNRLTKNYNFIEKLLPGIIKKLGKNVLLIAGPKPSKKMVWYYNAADVVIFPSLYECSPVVIKEAMACNIPIVASNVGDISRVFGNTKGCFVIEGWDEEIYIDKIVEAIKLKISEGRKRIFDLGYDWSQTAKKISDALLQCYKNYEIKYLKVS